MGAKQLFFFRGPIIACSTPACLVRWNVKTCCGQRHRIPSTIQSLRLFLTRRLHAWLHFVFRPLHPLGWPHGAVLSAAVTSERGGRGLLKPGCGRADSCHAEREGGRVRRRHPRIQDRSGHTDHRSAGWENEEWGMKIFLSTATGLKASTVSCLFLRERWARSVAVVTEPAPANWPRWNKNQCIGTNYNVHLAVTASPPYFAPRLSTLMCR